MSSPFAGAVMTTFLAPAVKCLEAPGVSMKTPVPSMTMSMTNSFHGNCNGSLEETIWMILTSASNVPKTESYLTKCEACLTPPESLMATTSSKASLPLPCQHLKKLRPIRPKPLMATLQVLPLASIVLLTDACEKGRNENICEQLLVSLLYTETGLLRSTQTR